MRKDLLPYVEQIRTSEKHFDVSRVAIMRLLLAKHGRCNIETDHDVIDISTGTKFSTTLLLNISTKADYPTSWSMALKLHGIRIDGIDHETKFLTVDGILARGWHRHLFDLGDEHADRKKMPIADMDGVETREVFVIRGLSLMRVRLTATDHGQELLFT